MPVMPVKNILGMSTARLAAGPRMAVPIVTNISSLNKSTILEIASEAARIGSPVIFEIGISAMDGTSLIKMDERGNPLAFCPKEHRKLREIYEQVNVLSAPIGFSFDCASWEEAGILVFKTDLFTSLAFSPYIGGKKEKDKLEEELGSMLRFVQTIHKKHGFVEVSRWRDPTTTNTLTDPESFERIARETGADSIGVSFVKNRRINDPQFGISSGSLDLKRISAITGIRSEINPALPLIHNDDLPSREAVLQLRDAGVNGLKIQWNLSREWLPAGIKFETISQGKSRRTLENFIAACNSSGSVK